MLAAVSRVRGERAATGASGPFVTKADTVGVATTVRCLMEPNPIAVEIAALGGGKAVVNPPEFGDNPRHTEYGLSIGRLSWNKTTTTRPRGRGGLKVVAFEW